MEPATPQHLLFVYGTLQRGCANHEYLCKDDVRFVCMGRTVDPYSLYVRRLPFLLREPTMPVEGEIYEVGSATLAALDKMEGHPRWYRRLMIPVETGHGRLDAWTYFMECELERAGLLASKLKPVPRFPVRR